MAIALVLAVLGSILTPSLARTKTNGRAIQCLENMRRLILAWQTYADDNRGRIVMVNHGGAAQGGNPGQGPAWVEGWLDWTTASDNTNVQFLIDSRWARLADYGNKDAKLFKCPSDSYLSAPQRARGWAQRVRSYSGNIGIGEGNAETGPFEPIYRHIRWISEFQYPGPAETWVYLEEHPDSINDGAFFNPRPTSWLDFPAAYHNGGTASVFADGHSEIHHWRAGFWKQVNGSFSLPAVANGDPDVHWMSYHAGRISTNSY